MPFLWFKNLGNVIPVRRFGRATRLPVRNVSDVIQLSLPVAQAVAGAIPLAGPPIQAAIGGLLAILQAIDWSSQMQNHNDMHEVSAILQRQQEDHQKLLMTMELMIRGPTATQLTATVAGCVTLIDATGYEHQISVNFCTSYQQLNDMLQVLFKCDSAEARIQRRYLEKGRYNLCIDEGTRVARLTSNEWSTIQAGTKIVMRVVFEQQDIPPSEVDYKCHFCGTINHLPTGS
ncbi:hypothetical protein DFH29DRAFT_1072453, partial [Suillus ampliporus]